MNNLWTNKKLWIFLVGLLIIIGVVLYVYFTDRKHTEPELKPLEVSTKELGNTQTPAGFPKNLPSEIGSKTLQNYESSTNDGRLQSTKKVTSSKAPLEALNLYVNFFKNEGYAGGYQEMASTSGGQQVAQMQKDQDLLMIVATPTESDGSEIEMTLVQKLN